MVKKSHKISRNQGFSYYFFMIIEGSGSRAGSVSESIPLTSGSGSGSWRPKNMWIRWIRIRIRNTDFGHPESDPVAAGLHFVTLVQARNAIKEGTFPAFVSKFMLGEFLFFTANYKSQFE
jgi:hypothetical protein